MKRVPNLAENEAGAADSSGSRRSGRPVPISPFAPLAHALLLLGSTGAVFLAGKPQEGALGVFLMCAGLAMLICPPQVQVNWKIWSLAGFVIVCSSFALLPEYFLVQPGWRQALDSTPSVFMPETISVSPRLTCFWLALLAVSLLVGIFSLTQPLRSRWLLILTFAAVLAAGLYAAMAIYAKETGWSYPFASNATFGFFPNRNHTATLLFVGSLLALGILSVVLREGRWVFASGAGGILALCVAGLVYFSPSRGGIVFLAVGIVLWFAGLGRTHRDLRLMISFAAVLLAVGMLFVLSGGEVRDRLLGRAKPNASSVAVPVSVWQTASSVDVENAMNNVSTDFRLKIYRDAFDTIRDFPVTGIGLGNFASVFPQYRRASLSEAVAIHPESDWLMLAAEAGCPAVAGLLAFLALAVRRLRPERTHPYWPLRWGCAVAATAAALHGLIDVPLHRVPLGWWVLAIAGLALQSFRTGAGGYSRIQHGVFIAGGIAALGLGLALVRAQWFGGPPLPPFAYVAAHDEFFRTVQHDRDAALVLAQKLTRDFPVEDGAYLCLGQTFLLYFESEKYVDTAFKAQRLLDPNRTAIPLAQGASWIRMNSARTAALWLEALKRSTRISEAAGQPNPASAAGLFGEMIRRAASQPPLEEQLWSATAWGPEFALAWIENATPASSRDGIRRLSADEDFLHRLDIPEQRRFLRAWYMQGDREALDRFLALRTEWRESVWLVRLRRLADAQQFERAVHEAAAHYGVSLALPASGPTPETEAPTSEQESTDPVAAFGAYWRTGNTRAARRVLEEAISHANPPQSTELWRLKTALAANENDWPAAWTGLQQVINARYPNELF